MAYGSAELSPTLRALAASDKPLLLGKNYLRDATAVEWRQGGSFGGGSDEADSDGPGTMAFDDHDHLQTYPDSAQNTHYLLINLGASNLGIVDSVALLNHNLGTLGATVYVQFDSGQNGTFGGTHEAASDTPSTDKRIVFLDLHHTGSVARRYSDVQYLRLKITGTAIIPRIGEIVLSFRRQLKRGPHGDHDPKSLSSRVDVFESDSGVITVYEYHTNRQRFSTMIRAHETAYITDFVSFFETDTEGGTLPFLYVAQPTTSPSDALWLQMKSPSLIGPYRSWAERAFALESAVEKGPHFLAAGV